MQLLTFNHHSIDKNSSIDETNNFFLNFAKGIDTYSKNNKSQLYTDIDNLITYEIASDYKISDAIKALTHRDLQLNIAEFMQLRCNQDCLNNLTKDEEDKILDYEIYFKEEGYLAKDYMILAFTLEKNAILLSFNRGIWNTHNIKATKKINYLDTDINFSNIATEEHAQFHIKNNTLQKLSNENIIYSNEFNKWLLNKEEGHTPDIDKVISKIQECIQNNFKIDLELVKPLDKEVFEIRVGSLGGLQKSQMRILFKFDNEKKYILWGLIKHGSNTYDYAKDIENANKIFKIIKEQENK